MGYNKLLLVTEMFMEARDRLLNANRNIDLVTSILLSGAVLGIVSPLVKEQKKHRTQHQLLAAIAKALDSSQGVHEGTFREIYNSLKHSGNDRKKIKASEDLDVNADLQIEACRMLEAARDDFNRVEFPEGMTLLDFDDEFYDAVTSSEPYALQVFERAAAKAARPSP